MGKRGNRLVPMRTTDAVVAARWLRGTAIPAMRNMPVTILGGGYAETIAQMERLANVMARKADRRRGAAEFTALVEVDDAATFARVVSMCRPAWPSRYHPAIVRLAAAMRDGGERKRRGRKSLTDSQIGVRVSGQLALDERHRKRLAARERRDIAEREWLAKVRARGETILTTTLPFSKI